MKPHPLQLRVPEIRFLMEQDGQSEKILKDRLALLFDEHPATLKAYLVKADFGNQQNSSVVLAIRMQTDPNKELVEKVGAIFASIFDADQHLDVMFLTDETERGLEKVCKPFFEQGRTSSFLRRLSSFKISR